MTPHIVQYQGSKRKLAPRILPHLPVIKDGGRLVEPFCGTCAVSIAAAESGRAGRFWLNDLNEPLVMMVKEAIERPDGLADDYEVLWEGQFSFPGGHVAHFIETREGFNDGDTRPEVMLYLMARCVKGSLRYSSSGRMNQSPDRRRHGTRPDTMRRNLKEVSGLLKGRCLFTSFDFMDVIEECSVDDVVYLDPPYQGTSYGNDKRYLGQVSFDDVVGCVRQLSDRGIRWALSYDGRTGNKGYGRGIPKDIPYETIELDAGRSAQATLLGRDERTVERLYVSL